MSLSDFILYLSITLAIAIAAYSIISVKIQQGKGFYMLREGITRVFLPLVISIAWMAYSQWNWYSFIVLVGFFTSAFVYLLLAQTEYFLGTIAKMDCLGRYDLYFHRFLKESDTVTNCKIYHHREVKLELNHILQNIVDDIKNDKDKTKEEIKEILLKIEKLQHEFDKPKIEIFYLFYVDTRDVGHFHKCLVYLTDRGLPTMRKLEGQLLKSSIRKEFFSRKFDVYVCFDIVPTAAFSQKLEANLEILTHVLAESKDARMIPVLKQRIVQANNRTDEVMYAFHNETASNIMNKEALGQKTETGMKTDKLFKIIIAFMIIFAALIVAFIALSIFGVI